MRLIDADKIDDELERRKRGKTDTNSYDLVNHFQGIIRTAPTVEERKHGRWEEDEDKDIYCTNCKHFLYPAEIRMQQITLSSRRLKRKFCPDCGAIMDGVSEDE